MSAERNVRIAFPDGSVAEFMAHMEPVGFAKIRFCPTSEILRYPAPPDRPEPPPGPDTRVTMRYTDIKLENICVDPWADVSSRLLEDAGLATFDREVSLVGTWEPSRATIDEEIASAVNVLKDTLALLADVGRVAAEDLELMGRVLRAFRHRRGQLRNRWNGLGRRRTRKRQTRRDRRMG